MCRFLPALAIALHIIFLTSYSKFALQCSKSIVLTIFGSNIKDSSGPLTNYTRIFVFTLFEVLTIHEREGCRVRLRSTFVSYLVLQSSENFQIVLECLSIFFNPRLTRGGGVVATLLTFFPRSL